MVGGEVDEGALVPAGLRALHGEQVGADLGSELGLGHRRDGDRHQDVRTVQSVDSLRCRAAEGEADKVHPLRFDHVKFGVVEVVLPPWLAQRNAQARCLRLQCFCVDGDLGGISRC